MANETRSGSKIPKWNKKSVKHNAKFQKLLDSETNVTKIGPVRVCLDEEFRLERFRTDRNVYIGLHDDGSEVAVKQVLTSIEDWKRTDELKILTLPNFINSDNIVKYRDHVCEGEKMYIIFDLCDDTLEEFVRRHPPSYLARHFPVLIKEILSGLDALHNGEKEAIHMDLNPWNILVDMEGHARLACFSLSTILNQNQSTLETYPIGDSNIWLAPESIKRNENGKVMFTKKSDVHVVGMICFYVLTGCLHPFGGPQERVQNIIDGKPVHIEKLENPEAKRFVLWLISHESKDRPSVREALAHPYLKLCSDTTTAAGDLCELEPMKKKERQEGGNNDHQPNEGIKTTAEIPDVGEGSGSGVPKWNKKSVKHEAKLQKLLDSETNVTKIGPVRVCFDEEFRLPRIRAVANVYLGLHDDGSEVSVKQILTNIEDLKKTDELKILTLPNVRNSDNILKYRDHVCEDNITYIIFDLCEETLEEFLRRQPPSYLASHCPVLIKEILSGLDALHNGDEDVIHMDLNPWNILVDIEGHAHLTCFSLSTILNQGQSTVLETHPKGDSNFWMAPESIKHNDDRKVVFTKKSDVHVVGMISFYVLTGCLHPFGAPQERVQNIIDGKPVCIEKLKNYPEAKRFVSWLISHDSKDRPSVREALEDPYLKTDTTTAAGDLCELEPMKIKERHEDGNNNQQLSEGIKTTAEKPDVGEELPWKWEQNSEIHKAKYQRLLEYGQKHPENIKEINGVRVCCAKDFLIGTGCDGTCVYIGLAKDGCEKAVKRLLKDVCAHLGTQEKKILNTSNAVNSKYVVRYWFYDDETDKEFAYLIEDLCEETLEEYVAKRTKEDLINEAPAIVCQILEGLSDLHCDPEPVLHRDLKPLNIMRNISGNWLLADFGISRTLAKEQTTHRSEQKGTKFWRAVESYLPKDESNSPEEDPGSEWVRYKKKSDIQVAGMLAFYILTKGEHPFGREEERVRNLRYGNPVGLAKLPDPVANDLISWMLQHKPEDRPSAKEALKHPYLQPADKQFELLNSIGNEPEIKTTNTMSGLVSKLNKDPLLSSDWKAKINPDLMKYFCTDEIHKRVVKYGCEWTECLRLIRNTTQHWNDRPRPRPEAHSIVGNPQEYFLKLFPTLPVVIHRIIRSSEWKETLQKHFM